MDRRSEAAESARDRWEKPNAAKPPPRVEISFWCANGHESTPSFLRGASVPESWDCPRCGWPAGRDEANPPAPPKIEPYKTHLAYVKERRSEEDAEAILNEALEDLRNDPF